MTIGEFAQRAGGTVVGIDGDSEFAAFALDSREVQANDLFLCIQGGRSDGHDFAATAIKNGALACVAERSIATPHILVENLVDALAHFASSVRAEFSGPVVGITGSNGKTSTKEFLAAALTSMGPVLKSPGNRNTEYSAPLLWHSLKPEHRGVVAELAMRGAGQIAHLAAFTRPTLAIITMIGTAHLEMVGSREGIAQAKAEIFRSMNQDGVSILWAEDDFLPYLKQQAPGRVLTFGTSHDADLRVVGYRPLTWRTSEVSVEYQAESATFQLATVGKHQALNAAAALLAATACGAKFAAAAQAITSAELPPMRMEIREWRGITIVLDNYNASPDSAVAALRTLCELPTSGKKIAVIGEMKELGSASESGHRLLGKALLQTEPDQVFLYGDQTKYILDEATSLGLPASRLSPISDLGLVTQAIEQLQPGDTVLIKGSRALNLEQVVEALPIP